MANWQERMRQIQEEEKQRIVSQRRQFLLQREEERLKRKQDQEAMELIEKQTNERNLNALVNALGVLDFQDLRKKLEEVNQQIWLGQGKITELRSNSAKSIRLSSDSLTQIPEKEIRRWREEITYWTTGMGEYPHPSLRYEDRHSERLIKMHQVIKPSYLEVGVVTGDSPFLYLTDTDIKMYGLDLESFKNLQAKFKTAKIRLDSFLIEEKYKDRNGKPFDKKVDKDRSARWWELKGDYSYYLQSTFEIKGIKMELQPTTVDNNLVSEFIEHGLAVSSARRIAQNK